MFPSLGRFANIFLRFFKMPSRKVLYLTHLDRIDLFVEEIIISFRNMEDFCPICKSNLNINFTPIVCVVKSSFVP